MVSQRAHNRLSGLNGRWIGDYEIRIQVEELRHTKGWARFSLYLRDRQGTLNLPWTPQGGCRRLPLMDGIYSGGGRWVKGWLEIGDYFPVICFDPQCSQSRRVDLSADRLDQSIFNLLSATIPPGGHLMFAYEVSQDSPFHRETRVSLSKGFPPVCTAQGLLLFRAGCRLVKDWYLAEGGHEGPRKLWGEKPAGEADSSAFDSRTFRQVLHFLARRPDPGWLELDRGARERALDILLELRLSPELLQWRDGVVQIYREALRTQSTEAGALRTKKLIDKMPHARSGKG